MQLSKWLLVFVYAAGLFDDFQVQQTSISAAGDTRRDVWKSNDDTNQN